MAKRKRKELELHLETNESEITNDTASITNVTIDTRIEDADHDANKKRKDKSRKEFSYEMKQLERQGLVKLNPKLLNKETGQLYDHDLHATCIICQRFRPYSDGIINLYRPYHDCYFFNHTQNKAHLMSKALRDRQEKLNKKKGVTSKEKTHTQLIISSFMVTRVKKKTTNAAAINAINESNPPSHIENSADNNDAPVIETQTTIVQNNAKGTR